MSGNRSTISTPGNDRDGSMGFAVTAQAALLGLCGLREVLETILNEP
jgi:hypothetical protein